MRPPVRSRPSWPGLRACLPAGWRPCWAVLGRCVPRFVFFRLRSGPWVLFALGSVGPFLTSSGLFVRPWPKHKVARPQFSHSSRSRSFSCSRSLLLGITSPRWLCAFTTTTSASLARKGVVGSKWASPWPDYTLQSVWTGQQVGVALALQSVWTSLRLKTVLRGSKWAAPWPTQH